VSSLAIEWTEKGMLPDAVVRAGIRRLLRQRLDEIGADGATTDPVAPGRGVPLVLDGTLLYLERYRVYEDRVATELQRRARAGVDAGGAGSKQSLATAL